MMCSSDAIPAPFWTSRSLFSGGLNYFSLKTAVFLLCQDSNSVILLLSTSSARSSVRGATGLEGFGSFCQDKCSDVPGAVSLPR
jgi:hypothetical protein